MRQDIMFFNKYAKEMFDHSMISDIPPVNTFPIWKKTDPYGRDYYGVSHFWSMDTYIEKTVTYHGWNGMEMKSIQQMMPMITLWGYLWKPSEL